jgi:hypothetical protein
VVSFGKCFLKACGFRTSVTGPSAGAVMLTHGLSLVSSDSSRALECLHPHVPDTDAAKQKCINTQ